MKYAGIIAALMIAVILVLYFSGYIGISEANIEKDARASQTIPEDWQVAKEATETITAMIFFPDDLSDHVYSIYVNRPGLSFGYFFRAGGSLGKGVAEFRIEGYGERAFISMNEQQVNQIDIDDGSSIRTVKIDSEKPFALILPVNTGNVTIYDINGDVIESIPYML
jgi:hypothetical protein